MANQAGYTPRSPSVFEVLDLLIAASTLEECLISNENDNILYLNVVDATAMDASVTDKRAVAENI